MSWETGIVFSWAQTDRWRLLTGQLRQDGRGWLFVWSVVCGMMMGVLKPATSYGRQATGCEGALDGRLAVLTLFWMACICGKCILQYYLYKGSETDETPIHCSSNS